jgi:RNA polymerase sigma-70 factor (ECF subfamily)
MVAGVRIGDRNGRARTTIGPTGLDLRNGTIAVTATLLFKPPRQPSLSLRERETGWSNVAALVERAQAGDRDAFGQLVEQFQGTVQAVCLRRLGNPSEAAELTQDVFLHVLRRIHQLREPERFAGWLRQVAVRMAINRATRKLAPPSVEDEVLEGAGAETSRQGPLDDLIARERAQRLWDGLGRLKALDRETLVAFYIRGQSLLEMAEDLETPVGTIKRRLHTARLRLKAELQAAVINHDEWADQDDEEDEVEAD